MPEHVAPRPWGWPSRIELSLAFLLASCAALSERAGGAECWPKERYAEAHLRGFEVGIERYRRDHGGLPDSLARLSEVSPSRGETYLAEVPADPWGRTYEYEVLAEERYRLVCRGADGRLGTDDDRIRPAAR
jgi:hypothetical protein